MTSLNELFNTFRQSMALDCMGKYLIDLQNTKDDVSSDEFGKVDECAESTMTLNFETLAKCATNFAACSRPLFDDDLVHPLLFQHISALLQNVDDSKLQIAKKSQKSRKKQSKSSINNAGTTSTASFVSTAIPTVLPKIRSTQLESGANDSRQSVTQATVTPGNAFAMNNEMCSLERLASTLSTAIIYTEESSYELQQNETKTQISNAEIFNDSEKKQSSVSNAKSKSVRGSKKIFVHEEDMKKRLQINLEIDAAIMVSLFPLSVQCRFLGKEAGWNGTRLHIFPEHMLNASNICDIGQTIRMLLIKRSSNDILFRLYQHSMPFIKHNRLQFPSMAELSLSDLKHMLNVMQMTLLGLHEFATKSPTFKIRRQILKLFYLLFTHGSLTDLYIFCKSNVYLLRVSLVENYINFIHHNMSLELNHMNLFIDESFEHARVARLIRFICDNFRMNTLHDDIIFKKEPLTNKSANQPESTLDSNAQHSHPQVQNQIVIDWKFIEDKAQQAIERINRTCRSLTNFKFVSEPKINSKNSQDAFEIAIRNLHRHSSATATHEHALQKLDDGDLLMSASVQDILTKIQVYQLPLQLQARQFKQLFDAYDQCNQYSLVLKPKLYVCFHCALVNAQTNYCNSNFYHLIDNIRFDAIATETCVQCSSNEFVFQINTLGNVIKILHRYFFFCSSCCGVHVYGGWGTEFFGRCPFTPAIKKHVSKACVVCLRSLIVNKVNVFDSKIGVMQEIYLCSKHTPSQFALSVVHDIKSLQKLIKFKSA